MVKRLPRPLCRNASSRASGPPKLRLHPTRSFGIGGCFNADLRPSARPLRFGCNLRDPETIDSELRLLAAVRRSIREHGGEPSSRQVDALLDERRELTGS
jgi:hypothetical protein